MDESPAGAEDVPLPPTPLLERDGELDAAVELLHRPDARLLTVTELGGIGKTRFAAQLRVSQRDAFADAVRFVSLEPIREAELVASLVACPAAHLA